MTELGLQMKTMDSVLWSAETRCLGRVSGRGDATGGALATPLAEGGSPPEHKIVQRITLHTSCGLHKRL